MRIRGGVDLVLDAMQLHDSHGDLQSAACGLLWKIAFADPPVRKTISDANGVAQIMGSMQHHATHPRLHYNACGALRHLLVTAPRQFSPPNQLPMRADSALPPIASGSGGGGRRAGGGRRGPSRGGGSQMSSVPVGAPPRMLLAGGGGSRSGLGGSNSNPHLRNSASGPVSSGVGVGGAGNAPMRPSTVAIAGVGRRQQSDLPEVRPAAREEVSTQALHLTLRSMADHPETALVQEYGCGTLYNLVLASPQSTRAAILHDGGVPIVLHAMRAHGAEGGVQINACALIKELAEHQPCLQQLDEGGARELLHAALRTHHLSAELSARAAEALRYLPDAPNLGM